MTIKEVSSQSSVEALTLPGPCRKFDFEWCVWCHFAVCWDEEVVGSFIVV